MGTINPNETEYVKNIRNTHCKGCMNENGFCSACEVLDCWLRKTYLPKGEWKKAVTGDVEWKLQCEISETVDKKILQDIVRDGFICFKNGNISPEIKFVPQKFNKGDIIHTIAYHYLEDEYGNDINQDVLFVNPKIINGEYKIVKNDYDDGYSCINTERGTSAYINQDIILENYKIK